MNVWLPEPVSKSIWRYGYFEEDVCLAMLYYLERGMTFIDVGAHIGFFTLLGSYLVGREGKVLSFEPTPSTYRLLKKNVVNCPNVCIYNCTAFSEETNIKFYDYGLEKSSYNLAFGISANRQRSLMHFCGGGSRQRIVHFSCYFSASL